MKFPAYPKYKASGVEWLGDVPEHWKVKAIKWESPVLRGASPRPIDDPIYFDDDGEFVWVRISDVTAAGMYLGVTEQKLSNLGSSLSVKLMPGALFLSIAGSVGKPCITQIKCCIHDGFVYFPRFKGEPKFLYYLFASGEPYRGLGKLGTQLNLNTDTVGSIVAGFPDKDEQQAIAAFLDRETWRIDRMVAKKRELIERLKEKRTALISRTVTRGLPPAAASAAGLPENQTLKPSGLDWLGDIPAHWTLTKLVFVSNEIGDGLHGTPEFADDSGIHFVNGNNLVDGSLRFFGNTRQVSKESHIMYRLPLGHNSILVSINGTIGNLAFYKGEEIVLGKSAAYINCGKKLRREFLFKFLLTDNARSFIDLELTGTTIRNLSLESIRKLSIPLPPLPEQIVIVAYLDSETAKLDALVMKVETAIERLQEYRTALIAAAVTGKIDVRGVENE